MNLKEVLDSNYESAPVSVSARRFVNKKIQKPESVVELHAIHEDDIEATIVSFSDKTDDLITLPYGKVWDYEKVLDAVMGPGYIIYDVYSKDTWYAHDEICLNKNFVYRGDIQVVQVQSKEEAIKAWQVFNEDIKPGLTPSHIKYILDDPASETYWPYSSSDYVNKHYGKPILEGTVIHRFPNRFKRDYMILLLEKKYSTESVKDVRQLVKSELQDDEALIVSDGSNKDDTTSYCYYYIDNRSVLCQTECCTFSDDIKCSPTIAEILGAYNAICQCVTRKKKKIRYYYDNSAIIDIFRRKTLDDVPEVKAYKDLLIQLDSEGYDITFCDMHPKTDRKKYSLNKALTFLHNSCDQECKKIARLHYKNYAEKALMDSSSGKALSDVTRLVKPKCKQYGNKKPYAKQQRNYYQQQRR